MVHFIIECVSHSDWMARTVSTITNQTKIAHLTMHIKYSVFRQFWLHFFFAYKIHKNIHLETLQCVYVCVSEFSTLFELVRTVTDTVWRLFLIFAAWNVEISIVLVCKTQWRLSLLPISGLEKSMFEQLNVQLLCDSRVRYVYWMLIQMVMRVAQKNT